MMSDFTFPRFCLFSDLKILSGNHGKKPMSNNIFPFQGIKRSPGIKRVCESG